MGSTVTTAEGRVMSAPITTTPHIDYALAFYRWLRQEDVFEPSPEKFGIDPAIAQIIARQCQIEFTSHQVAKAIERKRGES